MAAEDLTWHRRTWGSPEGHPVLLLHGFTWDGSLWEPVATYLGPGFQAIAVDLPGHGGTIWPPEPTTDRVARAIASLAAASRPTLVGYSLGARLALRAAVLEPEAFRALVLVSGTAGPEDAAERARRAQTDAALAAEIREQGIVAFVDRWERLPMFESTQVLPAAVRARLRAVRLAQDPAGLARSLEVLGQGQMTPLWDQLPDLHLPALLIAGEDDPRYVSLATRMAGSIPRSTLTLLAACGHAVPLEAPEALAGAIARFILS